MKDIIENNKLIAEFDGKLVVFDNGEYKEYGNDIHNQSLYYHSSWNWLMPVIEKIEEDVNDLQNIYFVEIFKSPSNNNHVCRVYDKSNKLYANCYGLTKLEATYKAVVEFIKWYNQNK